MKSIKTRILRSFLAVSVISLALTSLFSEISMFRLRDAATNSNEQIGSQAADSSETALIDQAVANAAGLADANARFINGEISQIATSMQMITHYINYLYVNAEEFSPIPFNKASECPPGVLVMQWGLAPGVSEEAVRDELYLHGNMQSVYEAVMKSCPAIYSIYISSETGINSGYDAFAETKTDVFEGRDLPWYENARDTGAPVISETYQDVFGRGLTVSMSAPCYGKNGEFIGVAGLDILIEDMNDMILRTVVGTSGYAMLLKGDEKIISAPGLTPENETDMEYFLGSAYSEIDMAMRTLPKGVMQSSIPRRGRNQNVYIIWSPVELTGWNLVFALPTADILAPAYAEREEIELLADETTRNVDKQILYSNLILIALFAAAILFVIIITARISAKITEPISLLTHEVERIGDGHFSYTSQIHTGDEVEGLSRSFERMTAELRNYIDNLARVTAEKERIGAELDVATKIQASMLPSIFPPFPERSEFELFASMDPAKEVGGDFYDFFLVDDNTLAVVIADVSGKGVPAALFMVIAKTLIKNNAQYGRNPEEVFGTVNNLLCENNDTGLFVTAFIGYLDIPSGRLTYTNAGHNPPLLHNGGESFKRLRIDPGFVLAGMEGFLYKQGEITLTKGGELFLYTDGVTEAVNNGEEIFGDPRLLETANTCIGLPLNEFTVSIRREIDRFADGAEQADDITMLMLRYNGGSEE